MNLRTLLLVLTIAAIAVFAAVNWTAFTAPTALSLIVTTVEAPLGVVMLGLTVIAVLIALLYAAQLKTSMLMESRNHSREMQAQRKLADVTEASRLTELQRAIEAGLQRQADQTTESRMEVLGRLDALEITLRSSVEQEGTTLSAYIGELEDRLERQPGAALVTAERTRPL